MATDTLEIIIKSKATGDGAKKAKAPLDDLKKAAKRAIAVFVALKGAQAAVDFVKFGAGVQRQSEALDNLARAAGTSGDAITKAIQEASDFTIDRMTAMTAANKALMLDVAKTPEEFERLAKVAVRLGQAMGQDAAKSIDDFVTAAGRQSMMIADNLGLTIKSGEAAEAYALKIGKTADALTTAEKKQAFLNAMLVAGEAKMAELGEGTESAATKFEKLSAAASDAKSGLAEMAAGFLSSVVDAAGGVDTMASAIRALPSLVEKVVARDEDWRTAQGGLKGLQAEMVTFGLLTKDAVKATQQHINAITGHNVTQAEQAEALIYVNGLLGTYGDQVETVKKRWIEGEKHLDSWVIAWQDSKKVIDEGTKAIEGATKGVELWEWKNREASEGLGDLAEMMGITTEEEKLLSSGINDLIPQLGEFADKTLEIAAAQREANLATAAFALDSGMNLKTMLESQTRDHEDAARSIETLEAEHHARLLEIGLTGNMVELQAEEASYMQARTTLNAHLVEQEAAHQASMGRFVLQAFEAWATMNGVSAEQMLTMRTAIAQEYGLIDAETATVMNSMIGSWESWAAGTGTTIDDVIADIDRVTDTINNMPTSKVIDIHVKTHGNVPSTEYGGPAIMQHGTPYARGGAAIVGEAGPELVYLPPGSRVYDAAQTQRRIGGNNITNIFNIYATEMDGRAIAAEVDRYMRMAGLRRIV